MDCFSGLESLVFITKSLFMWTVCTDGYRVGHPHSVLDLTGKLQRTPAGRYRDGFSLAWSIAISLHAYIDQLKRHSEYTTDAAIIRWLGLKGNPIIVSAIVLRNKFLQVTLSLCH